MTTFYTASRSRPAAAPDHGAMRPKWQKSRGGTPGTARGSASRRGPAESERICRRGRLVTGGGMATPAASCAGAHRRGRPAARSATPEQVRTGSPPQRPRELASARTTSDHEHQREADAAEAVTERRPKTDARRLAEGEGGHHPSPCGQALVSTGTCQVALKPKTFTNRNFSGPLDRTRPTRGRITQRGSAATNPALLHARHGLQ